jgi:hypothetical protein
MSLLGKMEMERKYFLNLGRVKENIRQLEEGTTCPEFD